MRNRLVGITAPGFAAGFAYDALGRRTGKTVQGVTTNYLYDGLNPVQEKAGASVTANILPGLGIDEYFTRTDSAGTRTVLPDALGSTLALTDSTGTLTTQYTYEPFGNTSVAGAPSTNSFQYTSRENDGTGLYYYRARYYSPRLQRFISEDPLEFGGDDVNLYAYVGNSPMNYVDPLGLFSMDELVAELPTPPSEITDFIVGFGDAFLIPELVRDYMGTEGGVNKCSTAYGAGKITGAIEGFVPFALGGGAVIGGTRTSLGHLLNHNRYIRIGPGRMGPPGVPRISIGGRPGGPHGDLRSRIPYVPPLGVLGGRSCGC